MTSKQFPFVIDLHGSQLLQISKVGPLLLLPSQLKAFAIILAVVVFPTPLMPVSKKREQVFHFLSNFLTYRPKDLDQLIVQNFEVYIFLQVLYNS